VSLFRDDGSNKAGSEPRVGTRESLRSFPRLAHDACGVVADHEEFEAATSWLFTPSKMVPDSALVAQPWLPSSSVVEYAGPDDEVSRCRNGALCFCAQCVADRGVSLFPQRASS
jgi:hypothetical protein